MKIATLYDRDGQLALVDNGYCTPLPPSDSWPGSMLELIENQIAIKHVRQYASTASERLTLDRVSYDAPLRDSQKLICIGKNYAKHAAEMGSESPDLPVIFSKFNSAINRPTGTIKLPPISNQVDFEAELVVVIGRRGKNIERQEALDHVFGYCCGNDISARDWQKGKPGGQWLLGKTFDTFAPLGPYITTKDEIADPHNLRIQLRLNGQTMQDSNTLHLIFKIDFLISHLSKFVTLEPGDLIFTGTPAGVGAGRDPQIFLQPGDQLEVEIEGLGILKNTVAE
jgi:2-keto-4-pentenoate hydratase/2-oxohepta-3-ene-1,7-dioic acid hydratase in catechol pathway